MILHRDVENTDAGLFRDNMPVMLMLVGLPGSGKSFVAEKMKKEYMFDCQIHSSDALRKELFGNEEEQEYNTELFIELHRRIREDLKNGVSVIYDATNINKKKRIAFLKELVNIPCYIECLIVATPYETCIRQNTERERVVPEDVIRRMYLAWQPPDYREGFSKISICYHEDVYTQKWQYSQYMSSIENYDQENSHHTLSLGGHSDAAARYVRMMDSENPRVYTAAILHDCGKPFTKSRLNHDGKDDGNCHYYNHQNVGAYDTVLYLARESYGVQQTVYISNLVYYHMHPYMSWKQSEKAMKRDREFLGEQMFSDIMLLHDADISAH